MAVATITQPTENFKLKSAPPDGYVTIRRMTWGEKLKRQSMMTKYRMEMAKTTKDKDMALDVDIMQEKVSHWEFANLIVEHNLTDEKETALNFRNIADIDRLGPIVGEEIQKYIDEMNSFEEEEEVKN